jgi:phosphoribosylformylglycinamidine cyclo-ligase
MGPESVIPGLGKTVAEALLAPHRCYFPHVDPLLDSRVIRGMAHITGGGITENLPRVLPEGTAAQIRAGSWPVLPIFQFIQEKGNVANQEMYRTMNMGIGLILIVGRTDVPAVRAQLQRKGEACYEIGSIVRGNRVVEYV